MSRASQLEAQLAAATRQYEADLLAAEQVRAESAAAACFLARN